MGKVVYAPVFEKRPKRTKFKNQSTVGSPSITLKEDQNCLTSLSNYARDNYIFSNLMIAGRSGMSTESIRIGM